MKIFHHLSFFILFIVLFSTNNINADTATSKYRYAYKVNFNNLQSHSKTLSNIQHHIGEKNSNNEELKIILFGKNRALSLDATTLSNTKISYGDTEKKIQEQMTDISKKGVQLIICKSSTSNYRHYSTEKPGTTADTEVQQLQSQGYNCNHYKP